MATAGGFLDPDDLRHLCEGAARVNAQEAWLKAKGIPYRREGRTLVVMWVHVQGWIEGRERPASRGINWGAINA